MFRAGNSENQWSTLCQGHSLNDISWKYISWRERLPNFGRTLFTRTVNQTSQRLTPLFIRTHSCLARTCLHQDQDLGLKISELYFCAENQNNFFIFPYLGFPLLTGSKTPHEGEGVVRVSSNTTLDALTGLERRKWQNIFLLTVLSVLSSFATDVVVVVVVVITHNIIFKTKKDVWDVFAEAKSLSRKMAENRNSV